MFRCSFILYGLSLLTPHAIPPSSRFVHFPYVLWMFMDTWLGVGYSGVFLFTSQKSWQNCLLTTPHYPFRVFPAICVFFPAIHYCYWYYYYYVYYYYWCYYYYYHYDYHDCYNYHYDYLFYYDDDYYCYYVLLLLLLLLF